MCVCVCKKAMQESTPHHACVQYAWQSSITSIVQSSVVQSSTGMSVGKVCDDVSAHSVHPSALTVSPSATSLHYLHSAPPLRTHVLECG